MAVKIVVTVEEMTDFDPSSDDWSKDNYALAQKEIDDGTYTPYSVDVRMVVTRASREDVVIPVGSLDTVTETIEKPGTFDLAQIRKHIPVGPDGEFPYLYEVISDILEGDGTEPSVTERWALTGEMEGEFSNEPGKMTFTTPDGTRYVWEGYDGGKGGEYIDVYESGSEQAHDVINTDTGGPRSCWEDVALDFTEDKMLGEVADYRS